MRHWIGALQQRASRCGFAVKLALLLRNQAECVIGYFLGESADHRSNGEELLAKTLAPSCGTFVDVGANTGEWTTMWLKYGQPHARGVLFEPIPALHQQLERRFGQNNGITVVNAAVGNVTGVLPFFIDETFNETSSLAAPADGHDVRRLSVPVCTLSETLPAMGFTEVDFLKIDAEGFDGRVLRGAQTLLASGSIRAIQFEYNSSWAAAGSTLTETLSFLRSYDYDTFLLRSDGLHPFNIAKYGEFFRYANFVAFKKNSGLPGRELLRSGL